MKEILTLKPENGSRPSKTITKRLVKVSSYTAGLNFTYEKHTYDSFPKFIYEEVLPRDDCFIILGELTEFGEMQLEEGKVFPRRKKKGTPTIQDREGSEIVLDLDDHIIKGFDALDPVPSIIKWLKKRKINCDVTWQITSSQQLNTDEARIRLYFEADKEYDLTYRKAYSQGPTIQADGCVYTSSQPIFTAPPKIKGGKDPIKNRTGFIKGNTRKQKVPFMNVDKIASQASHFRGGTVYDFNDKDLPAEVLDGTVYRRYFMPLAFHYMNLLKGDENAVFHIISGLAQQVSTREFDKQNVREYIADAKTIIEDEVEQQSLATSNPLLPGDTDKEYKYTMLPPLIGGIKILVDSALAMMRYPDETIAQVSAEHALSVFGGGIYHLNLINTTRKRVLIAPQGSGKSHVGTYMECVVEALGQRKGGSIAEASKYVGDDSFTFINQHKNIEEHRVRSFILNEAGQSEKTRAGDQASLAAYQLDVLSKKADDVKHPKKYSAARGKSFQSNTVYCGVWVYLHESVPGSYAEVLASKGAIESGSNSRDEFFFVEGRISSINRSSSKTKINDDALKIYKKLVGEFKGSHKTKGTDPANAVSLIEIEYSEITESLIELEQQIVRDRNQNIDDQVLTSTLARKYEKIVNYILLQAMADYGLDDSLDRPVATIDHFNTAVSREHAISTTLLYQMRSGHLAGHESQMIMSYENSLGKKTLLSKTAESLGCYWSRSDKTFVVTRTYLTKVSGNAPVKKYIEVVYRNDSHRARQAIIENLIGREILSKKDDKTFFVNSRVATK